jgi:hypothetical protein
LLFSGTSMSRLARVTCSNVDAQPKASAQKCEGGFAPLSTPPFVDAAVRMMSYAVIICIQDNNNYNK